MAFQQFELANWIEWGELVKDWSRGNEDRPTNPADFVTLLNTKRNVKAELKDTDFDRVEYRDHADRVIFINVPPKKMIDDAETELQKPNATYFFPPFYRVDLKDVGLTTDTPNGRKEFHHKRVGEYVVRFCG